MILSKEETKSGSLSHHPSKRKEVVVTGIEEFPCAKSWDDPLGNLIVDWDLIVWLFIDDKWPHCASVFSFWVELWRKEVISILLWYYFGLCFAFHRAHLFLTLPRGCHNGDFTILFLIIISVDLLIWILIFSFLFLRFPFDLGQFFWIGPVETLMMKIALSTIFSNFVKVVHVKLSKRSQYLPDKWWVIIMLEVLGQDLFGEEGLIEDNKTDAIGCPSYNIFVLFILNHWEWYIEQIECFPEEWGHSPCFLFWL